MQLFPNIPDFPVEGFNFPDITYLLESQPKTFRKINDEFIAFLGADPPDAIVCVESFGYLFGAPLALHFRCPIVLARRAGKLPRKTISRRYSMCYSDDRCLEINECSLTQGSSVLVVDDFLASGGTFLAVADVLAQMGIDGVRAAFVACIVDLSGRSKLSERGFDQYSVFDISFNKSLGIWEAANSE